MSNHETRANTQAEHTGTPKEPNGDLPLTEEWLLEQEFEAFFDDDGFKRAAEVVDDAKRRIPLHLTIAMLARSSADLMANAQKEPGESTDAFLESIESIQSRISDHKTEIEMMQSAVTRLLILCAKCCALAPDEQVEGGDE